MRTLLSLTLSLRLCATLGAQGSDPAKDLSSKDAEVRLAAVRSLVETEHEKREKLLVGALKDRDWEVVEVAAAGLGTLGAVDALPELIDLALDGPVRRIRRVAAQACAQLDAEEAAKKFTRKVAGKGAEAACEALGHMGGTIDGKISTKPFEKARKSKEPMARAAAARALVRVGGEARVPALVEMVQGEDVLVAAAALEGAGLSADPACLEPLFDTLKGVELFEVLERRARAACRAILLAKPDATNEFTRDAAGWFEDASVTPRGKVRLARLVGTLVEAEGPLERERARNALEVALSDSSEKLRAAATKALGQVNNDAALDRAARLLAEDADGHVRVVALEVLLAARGVGHEGTLELTRTAATDDPDASVRERAVVALGVRGLSAGLAPLVTALEDGEWGVAVCAAVSLGKTKLPEATAPLLRLAESADWRLRGAAIVGLAQGRQRDGVTAVIEALADPEPLIRKSAHEYLLALAKRHLGTEPGPWLAWWQESGDKVRMDIPPEVLERRKRLGYVKSAAEVYEGLDVIVLESRGDHIQKVLGHLGLVHRLTTSGKVADSGLHPDAVFVSNCTGEITGDEVERLSWFMRVGGYLFGSCWAVQETIARAYPGMVRRLPTRGEVLDSVHAAPVDRDSPWLEGVFGTDVVPIYELEGAYLIEVLDPERVEVLVDSPECAAIHGGGNMAAWFRAGHGVVLDSVNHFELQGFEHATGLKKPEQRMGYAVDHMGLTYEELRKLRGEKFWSKNQAANENVKDLSVFRLVTNFVRHKRSSAE